MLGDAGEGCARAVDSRLDDWGEERQLHAVGRTQPDDTVMTGRGDGAAEPFGARSLELVGRGDGVRYLSSTTCPRSLLQSASCANPSASR